MFIHIICLFLLQNASPHSMKPKTAAELEEHNYGE